LRFLDSGCGKQEITGRIRRIGNYSRHQGSAANASSGVGHIDSWFVLIKAKGRGQFVGRVKRNATRPHSPGHHGGLRFAHPPHTRSIDRR
jgi:hypothetical protein